MNFQKIIIYKNKNLDFQKQKIKNKKIINNKLYFQNIKNKNLDFQKIVSAKGETEKYISLKNNNL